MAKIDEVIKRAGAKKLPPLQKKILAELEKRKDEVFAYHDPSLYQVFSGANKNGIDWSMWALEKKGLIGKHKIKGDRTYFGSHEAIKALMARLDSASGNKRKGGRSDGNGN